MTLLFRDALQKFNPNHDPHDGRFTSGSGGSAGSSTAGSDDGREGEHPARLASLLEMKVPDRKKYFEGLSEAERDKLSQPVSSMQARMRNILGTREWPATKDETADAVARVQSFVDDGTIPADSGHVIMRHARDLANTLRSEQASPMSARAIVRAYTDAMIAQEHESIGRSLGDHGVRHLMQDTEYTHDILKQLPFTVEGADDPKMRAMAILAGAWHDLGYLSSTARIFLDNDHPRHSAMFYNEHNRKHVESALGKEHADLLHEMILHHADTDIDWHNKPEVSAFSLADNLALFHQEKLPAMMRYMPGNKRLLEAVGAGTMSIDDAKAKMRENLASTRLHEKTKARISKAIDELSPILPKLTLGMYGGSVTGFSWENDTMVVGLKRTSQKTFVHRFADLGYRQFKKLAEGYGLNEPINSYLERGRFGLGRGKVEFRVEASRALLKFLDMIHALNTSE